MPNIAAVILAAGESSRFGQSKQLIKFRGKTLVRRVVDEAHSATCAPVTVIVPGNSKSQRANVPFLAPSQGERIEVRGSTLAELIVAELKDTLAAIIENKKWHLGIGTSIRVGVQYVIDQAPNVEALLLLVCDQPFVDAKVINGLIDRRAETQKAIVASKYAGTLGVPAIFHHSLFHELLTLPDDSGAKPIIVADKSRVAHFSFPEGAVDIDTLADYEQLKETSS